jgi:hypothetical protein
MSRTSAGAVPAASATLWALGLIAAIAFIYGIRFNAPPVVSLQMIADPLRSIDDIEARHLANSPLWLWLAHGLGVNGFAGWVLLSTTLTGLAVAGLVAHVVATFKTDAEALEMANGTEFGLAAVVVSGNRDHAKRITDELVAGTIWVNCFFVRDLRAPFGGSKKSGVGREGGNWSFDFYADVKNTVVSPNGWKE